MSRKDEYVVPQRILDLLNPQYTVTEDEGVVVLSKRVGDHTVSVRGCQSERMCVHVVVRGRGKLPMMQSYGYFRAHVDAICDCLNAVIDRYGKRGN